jgi:diaminobutyrate-2-oxoglutarate transaminase
MTMLDAPPSGTNAAAAAGFELESEVRIYSRAFPAVFTRAKGAELYDEGGRAYLDFLCGAGTLNYGHNPDHIKHRLIEHLTEDRIVHGLDMYTTVKRDFLAAFSATVLAPRGLDYKVQFCGPTGANAVEAALKLARKVTGRRGVVSFSGGFHGMSAGAAAVSGAQATSAAPATPSHDVHFLPYQDGPGGRFDAPAYLDRMLSDPASGLARPAAVIVEPMQIDGGVYQASARWLADLRAVTSRHEVLLICDEIQTGCGRTGTFFNFEQAGIEPDLITVSKSLSGYGLPLAAVLLRPGLDVWAPGEHTGTFRANQLALLGATAALELWRQPGFAAGLHRLGRRLAEFGAEIGGAEPGVRVRGAGALLGLDLAGAGGGARARAIQRRCFDDGLIVELCGRDDAVIKVMPPLTIGAADLDRGLSVLTRAVGAAPPVPACELRVPAVTQS